MTDALFSALDVQPESTRTGYRLQRFEIYNWGTFDKQVWSINPSGNTSLLTGDIGSGKSTLVDALTTLLLPAQKITFNKAAGAQAKERTLRSYVEGHYRSERNEATGASRPVGLRDHSSYSVILGIFVNEGYDETVSLAQVFRQQDRAGQPDRFYVTSSHSLSIENDFSDFGSTWKALRSQLKARGAEIDDTFPLYSRRMRRMLGIRSEQAMDLFQQTVSMKSVGNLNEFVREHMLEPTDATERIRGIVDHFENLTKAHQAVRTATDQIEVLTPLIAGADKYDAAFKRHHEHREQREALVAFMAELTLQVVDQSLATLADDQRRLEGTQNDLITERQALQPTRDRLLVERGVAGGDRLSQLEAEIPRATAMQIDRERRWGRFEGHLESAGLGKVTNSEEFRDRHAEALTQGRLLDQAAADFEQSRRPLLRQESTEDATVTDLSAEIASLESRRNNLPGKLVDLRQLLCEELQIAEAELPFAGELIDVHDDHAQWRGAAERVLHGFARNLLVPQRRYDRVSQWVNDHHLGTRLVYLRVPERQVRAAPAQDSSELRLFDVLEVEPGVFADYLQGELFRRADHHLVDSVKALAHHDRAVTLQGLVRSRDWHEKNDQRRADDPRYWVLGRASERKLAALRASLDEARTSLVSTRRELAGIDKELKAIVHAGAALTALAEYTSWDELDVSSARQELARLQAERERLVSQSSDLAELDRLIAQLDQDNIRLGNELTTIAKDIGAVEQKTGMLRSRQRQELSLLESLPSEVVDASRLRYPLLQAKVGRKTPTSVDQCDTLSSTLTASLTQVIEQSQREMNGHTTIVQQHQNEFLRRWPEMRGTMDPKIEATGEYRRMFQRLTDDDLPRYEAEFKNQLNTNAVRELLQFNSWLRRQADEIHDRVARINEALGAIDYNPGRIITLQAEPTINQEIRLFRADLKAATSESLTPDEADAERRFEQVSALIERFRGRPQHSESDKAWTKRVTDVRGWFSFAASERDRETDEVFEHYTDSDGKSGGQKEKLAYTILAASLAYQFGLEWGVEKSKDFRFAVIDEAFGRGSDVSTRYALELFAKLGLQLLIVTPLQKVNVIEPYVSAIGFVDNPEGSRSRVTTLTIEEFQDIRAHNQGRQA